MSRIEQFTLDLGDGAPPLTVFDGKTFDSARMGTPPRPRPPRTFDGRTYDAKEDRERLAGQYERVWNVMVDEKWRTLAQIALATNDPPASISARLRDFRKGRNGSHRVDTKRVAGANGLYIYRLTPHLP